MWRFGTVLLYVTITSARQLLLLASYLCMCVTRKIGRAARLSLPLFASLPFHRLLIVVPLVFIETPAPLNSFYSDEYICTFNWKKVALLIYRKKLLINL